MRIKGFTLYELLIAIALISILSAIAAPPFITWINDFKFHAALISLKEDMEFAKSSALKENSLAAINFYENFYEIFLDMDADWQLDDDEKLLSRKEFLKGISIDLDETTFKDDRTRFKGTGIPSAIGTVVLIDDAGRNGKISLSILGKITVKK